MTRLIFFCVAAAAPLVLNAQKSTVYFRAGMNLAKVSEAKHIQVPDQTTVLLSYQMGFTGDIPINKIFSIQPSLVFTGKGSKIKRGENYGNTHFNATGNPFYIELPVNFVVKISLPKGNSSFFFGAGPYIAYGITGKSKVEGKFFGTSYSRKNDITYTNDDVLAYEHEEYAGLGVMRRIDYGYNGIAGLQFNRIFVAANYGFGMAELQKNIGEVDDQNKHRVFSLLLGWRL
jgi:hypothetical protein